MPTSVINEILSFCPQGTIASGDIMALEDYKNDVQRLRGHQPGIARRELENMALRQSSFVAAGSPSSSPNATRRASVTMPIWTRWKRPSQRPSRP